MVASSHVKINTTEARVDMVLAQPIIDQQGRVIMTAGSRLTPVHLKRFERWGVTEIVIQQEGKPEEAVEAEPEPDDGSQALRIDEDYMHRMAAVFNRRFAEVADKPIMAALKKNVFKSVVLAGRDGLPGVRENSVRGH